MADKSFSDLDLIKHLLDALKEEGYEEPTQIQVDAIPHILAGRDIIGCAQTGTGKTAAFALPILQKLYLDGGKTQPKTARALVLTPTRELAAQIGASFKDYGRHTRRKQATVFGGVPQSKQVKKMSYGVDVLIATPGRLLDLINQGHIRLDHIEIFVLDEADRMLDMGFINDIKKIIKKLPGKRQTLLFSATMPKPIIKLANTILTNPVEVSVAAETVTVELVGQHVMYVDRENKTELLKRILGETMAGRTLIFTRTKRNADRLVKKLNKAKHYAMAIHGDKSQGARNKALKNFRRGRTPILVATDIAARGIDVDDITHVINYEIPDEPEVYVHRIGRTARAGAEGTAISLVESTERNSWNNIEKYIKKKIPAKKHPWHSDTAQNAKGKKARRPPRGRARSMPKTKHKKIRVKPNPNKKKTHTPKQYGKKNTGKKK